MLKPFEWNEKDDLKKIKDFKDKVHKECESMQSKLQLAQADMDQMERDIENKENMIKRQLL